MAVEGGVEGVVCGAVVLARPPAGQGGGFVVDEEAAVFDGWFAVDGCFGQCVERGVLGCWDVGPPVEAEDC